MALKLVRYPDPFLFVQTKPVAEFGQTLNSLLYNMRALMKEKKGIGLAANQVSVDKQIFIMDLDSKEYNFINPKILSVSNETYNDVEGCLSFPGVAVNIKRAKSLTLQWQNENGILQDGNFCDLAAKCIQHEIDHLNGITFLNYIGNTKKMMLLKKLK